jgi:hypothetical protein
MARPNLLIGHVPLAGAGSQDRYQVVGNVFYYNAMESLFQGEGNLLISENIFVNPAGAAIVLRPHHDVPRQIEINNNFVAASSTGINISGGHSGYTQLSELNSVYAALPLAGGLQRENATGPYAEIGVEFARWIARARSTMYLGARDWTHTLKQMAQSVCAIASSPVPGTVAQPLPNGTSTRNCQFLRSLVRESAGHIDG